MWNKLNIKWQLVFFMTAIVLLVQSAILYTVYNLQNAQSKESAITQVNAISQALKDDFIKISFLDASAPADMTKKLRAFNDVHGLLYVDTQGTPRYKFGTITNIQTNKKQILSQKKVILGNALLIQEELIDDGVNYGYLLIDTDLSLHQKRVDEILFSILKIFPVALLLGFIISLFLGESYTRPFKQLLNAMKKSNPTQDKIVLVQTDAQNEIKEIFDGYNSLMQEVASSSKQLYFQANHDRVTGIKNRFFIEKALDDALQDTSTSEYALFYIDLDQMSFVKDAAGYQAGDALLKMLVDAYSKILLPNSLFARVDESGLMILQKMKSKEEILEFLEKSLEKLRDFRFSWEGQSYSISANIGLVFFKPFEYTLTELVKALNSTTHYAKAQGKNKGHIYNPDDTISQRYNKELETASFIKEALDAGPSRFELFAQDIVPLQYETEQVSYEILIRMWDKDNNFIPPDNFLPTAQRYHQMHEIDIWVLWTYLESVTKHPEHIENLHSAHINLAGSSLTHPDFQAKVKEAVVHFNFPWNKLELEVTETSAVGNFSEANAFIVWLKNVGIGLALDDFGTGMASFEYLKSMPFDVVKIDGSFVKDMHTDPIDKAVIKYIHEITELKGQETVAEYVETQEDVDTLTEIGITYGQGYFLGKPKPLQDWL